MARLQLIFPLLFWVIWKNSDRSSNGSFELGDPYLGTAAYVGMLLSILALLSLRLRRLMRRTTVKQSAAVPAFHKGLFAARWLVLSIHLFALFALGLGQLIIHVPDFNGRVESLQAFASLLPVVLVWIGLLDIQFPLERAVREQNALFAFEFGEPVHMVPTRWQFLSNGIRQQILFTLFPLGVAAILRDGLRLTADHFGLTDDGIVELGISIFAVAVVIVVSPEFLRRVLQTEPLPASPLRDRLEQSCKEFGIRFRDILLWRTHHTVANAAVMGLFPQIRFVLLSDRLIETMSEQQTQAVFAHEAGHIVYRHLAWYTVFFVVLIIGMGAFEQLARPLASHAGMGETAFEIVELAMGGLAFFVGFGALSRLFERQADLFAARSVPVPAMEGPVQIAGVAAFSNALLQVARLNNMPLDGGEYADDSRWLAWLYARCVHHAGTWLHGSIRSRIDFLERLTLDPARTIKFDRLTQWVRMALLVSLVACLGWAVREMFNT